MASVSSGQQDVGHEGVATRCGDLSLCSFARSCGIFSSCTCRYAFGAEKLLLFPQKSPPALQSTHINGNYDNRLVLSLAYFRIIYSCLRNKQLIDFLVDYYSSWIVVEGGDSSGISGTVETPQIAKRPRRLTARPVESVRL